MAIPLDLKSELTIAGKKTHRSKWGHQTATHSGQPLPSPKHNNRKSAIQDLLLAHQHEARGRSDADAGALLGRGALRGQAQAPGSHFDWKLSAK